MRPGFDTLSGPVCPTCRRLIFPEVKAVVAATGFLRHLFPNGPERNGVTLQERRRIEADRQRKIRVMSKVRRLVHVTEEDASGPTHEDWKQAYRLVRR